jgi:hypothetical protein
MNPHACRMVLRPRGPLELVDLATVVARVDAGPLARLSAIALAPVVLLSVAAFAVEPWLALGVAWAGSWVVQPVFTAWVARRLFADSVPLSALVEDAEPILAGIGVRLAGAAAIAVASPLTCGLLLPCAPWLVLWLGEVAQLERAEGSRLLGRVGDLLGRATVMVPVGGILVLLPFVGALAGEIVGQTVTALLLDLGTPWGLVIDGRGTPFVVVGVLVVQPLLAVVRVLGYLDARTRGEGWDVQVAVRGLAEGR